MRRTAVVLLLALFAAARQPTRESRARETLSQISGSIQVGGLEKPVTVLRDRWGVPHIYASNQHDLFFAQGFVAAQDRLFQMELWKRVGQGRLAEVLGPKYVQRDVNARLLRYRGPMDAEYASYAPDAKAILEAFTDGINAYIATRTAADGPGLPLEFQVAGFVPEPWRPEDCLMRMAGFPMTGNAESELYHAQLVASLGANRARRLLELDPPVELDPSPRAEFAGLSPDILEHLVGSDTRLAVDPAAIGSNNWTVSGKLTATGKPFLANDPHRTIAVPSLRYIVHLVAPGWDVIGAGEPAQPGVAVGHNTRIAWGFTVFGIDQQDLYIEQLHPSDRLLYRTEQGWERMHVEKETVRVRGGKHVEATLKFTRHGPVLWEDNRRALAVRWVGSEPGTAGYLGSLSLNRARDWNEFLAAVERWKVPSENLVYADVEGNIGEISAGLAPVRHWSGLLPVPGFGGYEWNGFLSTGALPQTFNPNEGFIATANHKMIPKQYPHRVGHEWSPSFRYQRIADLLSAARDSGKRLGTEDMAALQNDVQSMPAATLQGVLRQAIGNRNVSRNAQMLLGWNGNLTRDSAAAAVYEVWLRELRTGLVARLVPARLRKPVSANIALPLLIRIWETAPAAVFGANPRSSRDRALLAALDRAAEELTRFQGADRTKWSWGALHVVHFQHPLEKFDGMSAIASLGPLPRPGDTETVNSTGLRPGTFEQSTGASYRQILDLADWDRSLAVNTPGQSGQPGSPHYSDLLPLWDQGEYFPLLYSRELVEREAVHRLVLQPER